MSTNQNVGNKYSELNIFLKSCKLIQSVKQGFTRTCQRKLSHSRQVMKGDFEEVKGQLHFQDLMRN